MLDVCGLRAGYGAINVLWDVDVHFRAGRLTAILGPNGAGKTTLLRSIMGQVPATRGSITLDGRRLDSMPTWQVCGLGVAMIPEGRMIFGEMSVEENLLLGAYAVRRRDGLRQRLDGAYATFPRLRDRRLQRAGSLSGGEAQMLALARGLMSGPRLLLVDEPSLGLAPIIVTEILAQLAALRSTGATIALVEQNTERAVAIADDVYVMQGGRIVLSQPAADVDRLHPLYFGR